MPTGIRVNGTVAGHIATPLYKVERVVGVQRELAKRGKAENKQADSMSR